MFSYQEEEALSEAGEQAAKELIMEIIGFNRNYKRKPKKFRRTSTHNYDTLEVPRKANIKRTVSNDSYSNCSNSLLDSKSNYDSEEDFDDDIQHPSALQPVLPAPYSRTTSRSSRPSSCGPGRSPSCTKNTCWTRNNSDSSTATRAWRRGGRQRWAASRSWRSLVCWRS
jgi:hypothetical protein